MTIILIINFKIPNILRVIKNKQFERWEISVRSLGMQEKEGYLKTEILLTINIIISIIKI